MPLFIFIALIVIIGAVEHYCDNSEQEHVGLRLLVKIGTIIVLAIVLFASSYVLYLGI